MGNDIYGNPVKQIKFDIKQLKVGGPRGLAVPPAGSNGDLNLPSFLFPDVQGSQPGHRRHLHGPLLLPLRDDYAGYRQRVSDNRWVPNPHLRPSPPCPQPLILLVSLPPSPRRQAKDRRLTARHPVRLHPALGENQPHPEEGPD